MKRKSLSKPSHVSAKKSKPASALKRRKHPSELGSNRNSKPFPAPNELEVSGESWLELSTPEGRSTGDPRLATAFRQLKIPYEVRQDGDFRVEFAFPDGWSHVARVRSSTDLFADREYREIYAWGPNSDVPFGVKTTRLLLERNNTYPCGAWKIVRLDDGRCCAIFSLKVPADLCGKPLVTALAFAAKVAHTIERLVTGKDAI